MDLEGVLDMQGSLGSKVAQWAGRIGLFMAVLGIISSVLYVFDYNVQLLMWVDMWGPIVGWVMRIGFIIVGGAIAIGAQVLDPAESPEAQAAEAQQRASAWEAVKNHPRTQQMSADLSQGLKFTFDEPADPETYWVRKVLWQDVRGSWLDPSTQQYYSPDDPRVTSGSFYLERQRDPKRLVAGQNFTTRQVVQQEPHDSVWSMIVGPT